MQFQLNYIRFHILFTAFEDASLNEYHGSMIRGAMGRSMHKLLCNEITDIRCESCSSNTECLYVKLFYGLRHAREVGPLTDMGKLPNPYVIKPLSQGKRQYKRCDEFAFELILIGDEAINHAALYLLAIKDIEIFFAQGRSYTFKLISIADAITQKPLQFAKLLSPGDIQRYSEGNESHDNNCNALRVVLKTPLRLQEKGKLVDQLSFELIMKSGLRRLAMLTELYGIADGKLDHLAMIELAKQVSTYTSQLKWLPLQRRSTFKNEYLSLGGLVGEITFKGDFELFNSVIFWMELLHIGKGTTNGEGWLQCEFYIEA